MEFYSIRCHTRISYIWTVIFTIYIGILEAIAVILALKIRNVTIKAVNDSKDVIDIVFIVTVTSVVDLISSFFLGDYNNIGGGLRVIAVLFGATSVIVLIFVPKVWQNSDTFIISALLYRCGLYTKTLMVRVCLKRKNTTKEYQTYVHHNIF